MPSRPSPRLSATILLTILAGMFAALAGILGNLATSTIPSAITPYLRFAWPALGVVVLPWYWRLGVASPSRCSLILTIFSCSTDDSLAFHSSCYSATKECTF